MPDLTELPDLAGDVRARAVPPPYDEVGRRVRAHRRRVSAGVLAATVLVVGGAGVTQSLVGHDAAAAPHPAEQGPLPASDPTRWRAVVHGTQSHPFEVSGTDDGSIAVVWRALEPGSPTFALVIREPNGRVHGLRLDVPVSLTPVPGGWVGTRDGRGWLIGSDGTWIDLGEPGISRTARPGDVVVRGQFGLNLLYSPTDRTWSTRPQPYGDVGDSYVTPDGVVVTCRSDGQGTVTVVVGEELQENTSLGDACTVAGRGGDVTVVSLSDEPDGSIPMTGLLVLAGDAWTRPHVTHPLDGVSSAVVTPAGSTVVTNASDGRWLLVRSDGEVTEPGRKVGEAFVAGDRLYVSSYGLMNGPLFYSEDDGVTWTETTLPGNESKAD